MVESVERPKLTTPHEDATSVSTSYPPPYAIFSLPAEITQHILSFCNFPTLENFRHTSRFSMTFPDPKLLKRAEEEYRQALFEKEKRYAEAVEVHRLTQEDAYSAYTYNNLHEKPITRAPRLHCFTCYSSLDRERFVHTQKTGRRTYGHADAMKRFCISCGFKQKKWSRGTCFRGWMLPCVRCQRIAFADAAARERGLCASCFLRSLAHSGESAIEGRGDSDGKASATLEDSGGKTVENSNGVQILGARGDMVVSEEVNQLSLDVSLAGEMFAYVRDGIEWTLQSNAGTSKRAERCVRCWMVDHTYQPAVIARSTVGRLCASCQSGLVIEGADSKVPVL